MAETTIVLVLKDGADIFNELEKAAKDHKISYGMIVSGCGKIKNFELVSNSPGGGVNKMRFSKEFEVNAISGKIQRVNGKPTNHVRISITATGFIPMGGQLVSGEAAGKFEIGIRKIDTSRIIEA